MHIRIRSTVVAATAAVIGAVVTLGLSSSTPVGASSTVLATTTTTTPDPTKLCLGERIRFNRAARAVSRVSPDSVIPGDLIFEYDAAYDALHACLSGS